MIIESVKLVNFRSHAKYDLRCRKQTSLILGPNGCGKTSVLEAIYIGLCGKSFRAVDNEILKRGEDFYRVEIDFVSGERVVVAYDGKKSFLVGDKKTARLPKKYKYPVVLFQPDDLRLMGSSPVSKRDYFDRVNGQFDAIYATILAKYNKALRQRNELLKKMAVENSGTGADGLFSWNVMLAKYGTEIRRRRKWLVENLNQKLTEVYRSIAKNQDEAKISYDILDGECSESEFLEKLSTNYSKDLVLGHTSYGAHRDNYNFFFNETEADGSASRGEVRSMILAMKFIEADLIYEKTKLKPLVLLDDVFSELDGVRQKALVTNFSENQVILTSVEAMDLS